MQDDVYIWNDVSFFISTVDVTYERVCQKMTTKMYIPSSDFTSRVLRHIFKTQYEQVRNTKRLLINLTKYWKKGKSKEQNWGAGLDSPGIWSTTIQKV